MNVDFLEKEFVTKYTSVGEYKFYQFLLMYAINKLVHIEKGDYKGISPDLEFLEYHDQFMILYRRLGKDIYITIAKSFRKAAHKVYRIMLKKKLTERNLKFLNLV